MEYDREEARMRAVRRHKAEKRKRMRHRRHMLLGAVALILLVLLAGAVLLIIRAMRKGEKAAVPEPAAAAAAEATAASPTPAPDAVRATPVPAIQAPWYQERMDQLFHNLSTYGNYSDSDALYAALEEMQIDPNGKMLAITFDDGPSRHVTGELLDVLEANRARATFFVCGTYIDDNKDLIRRELGLGCEIGNHTSNHENLAKLSPSERRATVGRVNDKMNEFFGYRVHLLRPPYISLGKKGDANREDIVAMAKEYELAIINHTRSSHDSHEDYTAQMMIDRILAEKDELGRGLDRSILLFHDKYSKTVEAMKVILPALKQKGYQLVTVSELLNCSKEGLNWGWIYSMADRPASKTRQGDRK